MRKWTAVAVAVLLAVSMLAGCGTATDSDTTDSGDSGSEDAAKGPIAVGSKIDIEGPILGQIIIQMLEANGFEVEDQTRTGATDVVRNALLAGQIDVYPEYTANALTVFFPDAGWDPDVLTDARETYETAAELDSEANGIVWLEPAPANNTWAVAIPRELAEAEGISTLADWADYINAGGEVKLVGSQEFFDREDAFPGFEEAYGFQLAEDQKVVLATGDTAVTEKAAAEGTDGANAAMAYGTDGTIAALDLVVLDDPLGVQPIYQPAPTFRSEVYDMYPEVADILDPVFMMLDIETLQELNARAAVDGEDPAVIVEDWLTAEGLLE